MVELSRGGADAAVMREFDVENRAFVDDGFEAVRLGDRGGGAARPRRRADVQRDGAVGREGCGDRRGLAVAALGELVVDAALRLAGRVAGGLGVSEQQEACRHRGSPRNACVTGCWRISARLTGGEPGSTSEP